MKESATMRIKRYISGDYYIDIVENRGERVHEAWIQHKDYGISELAFAVKVKQMPFYEFFRTVEGNLEQYKEDYAHKYMDEEVSHAGQ